MTQSERCSGAEPEHATSARGRRAANREDFRTPMRRVLVITRRWVWINGYPMSRACRSCASKRSLLRGEYRHRVAASKLYRVTRHARPFSTLATDDLVASGLLTAATQSEP